MDALASEYQKLTAHYRRDPAFWCTEILQDRLWEKQAEILKAIAADKLCRVAVRAAQGVGKTFTASRVAGWFLTMFTPATVITTAPTNRQVKEVLWREIRRMNSSARMPLGGEIGVTQWQMGDNRFAIGFTTDEPEKFLGLHNRNVLVIVDEASGVPFEVFQAIENPLSTGERRNCLLIGNPTQAAGGFFDAFTSTRYQHMKISAFDSPNFTLLGITRNDIITGEWREKYDKYMLKHPILPYPELVEPVGVARDYDEWGSDSYLWRVYKDGEFPDLGVDTLFSLPDIEAAIGRETFATEKRRVAALDVSRYGDDETVYILREGDNVIKIKSWSHQNTEYTKGRTIAEMRVDKPETLRVDSIGVGGPVADAIEAEGYVVDMVNVGEAAIDTEHYLNKRAENYWLLSRIFVEGKIGMPDQTQVNKLIQSGDLQPNDALSMHAAVSKVKRDLMEVRYTYNRRGQLQIESKEDMRRRGVKSPDYADALMMCFMPLPVASSTIFVKRWG